MLRKRILKIIGLNLGLWAILNSTLSQVPTSDTVFVSYGQILVLKDTMLTPGRDTLIIVTGGQKYKIKRNPQLQSQAFYDSLQVKSKKKRLMNELYRATIINKSTQAPDTTNQKMPELVFLPYNGYTIRNIHLAQVDLITGSVIDTSKHATDGFAKLLNNTHINTKEGVIRKNLVFKEGESVDANRMVENERFLRSLRYIDDARIVLIPVGENQVDVLVITKDLFPISFSATGSTYNVFSVTFNHRNIVGTGHSIRDRVLVDGRYSPLIGNRFDYDLDNIAKSFVNLNLRILTTPRVANSYVRLTREFITPETKYAGGMEVNYLRDRMGLAYPDSTLEYEYALTSQNIWFGRSFMLNSEKRSNLILTAKFSPIQYQKRPIVSTDSNQVFQNSNLVLGSVSFLQYKTIKTRYLKSFGRVEDVPIGFLASFTGGYLHSDIWTLGYTSFRAGYAKSFMNGSYFQVASDFGSFFRKSTPVQGLFFFKTGFFSPLIKVYNSQLRFGGVLRYRNGINRFKYEWINLTEEVRGVSADNSRGTSKTTLTSEAVLFTNSFIYGFRLAPYVFANYGLIRNDQANPYEGNFYSGIGIGLRIRNESLVFQTLDISFAVYPNRQTGDKLYRVLVETSEPDIFNDIKVGEPYVLPF